MKADIIKVVKGFFKSVSPSGGDLRAVRRNTKKGGGRFRHGGKGRFVGTMESDAEGNLTIDVGAPPTVPVDASLGVDNTRISHENLQSYIEVWAEYSGTVNESEEPAAAGEE